MKRIFRTLLILISLIQLTFATGFFLQWPVMTSRWPFEGTTPLTFILVSSIFAAAGAATLWAAASKNYGALAGIGLDYIAILGPLSILSFQLWRGGGSPLMISASLLSLIGVLFGAGLFLWSSRIPIDSTIPIPPPLRWSFLLFIVVLAFVSVRLILKVPNTIPWTITPELSVAIGWMFLGAALYFTYGLLRPSWLNSAGQLIGFLAYDLVLIVPFLTRLPTAPPEFRLGLILYTAVVAYSGLLAIFIFLCTHLRESEPGCGPGMATLRVDPGLRYGLESPPPRPAIQAGPLTMPGEPPPPSC